MDWAGEYGGLGLEEVRAEDISLEGLRASEIVDAFQLAFSLTAPQASLLLRTVEEARTIGDVARALREMAVKSPSEAEIRDALLRRVAPLEKLGLFEGRVKVEELLSRRVRVDLSTLPFEARRLASNIILRLLYNAVTARRASVDRAVIVVEEAQNVIPPRRPEQPPSGGEVIVNELRKHGVSVIAVAQAPNQVQPEAWRNAEYVVLHRCKLSPLEAQYLHLDAEKVEELARLSTGRALLLHRGRARRLAVLRPWRPRLKHARAEKPSPELEELRRRVEELEAGVKEAARPSEDERRLSDLESQVKQGFLEASALKERLGKLEAALRRLDEAVGTLKESADVRYLKEELSGLKGSIGELAERLSRVEERLNVIPDVERVAAAERKLSELQGEVKVIKAALSKASRRLAERVRKILEDYGIGDLLDVSSSLGEVLLIPKVQGAGERIEEVLQRCFVIHREGEGWIVLGERR